MKKSKLVVIALSSLALSSAAMAQTAPSGGFIEFGATGFTTGTSDHRNDADIPTTGSRQGLYGAVQASVPMSARTSLVVDVQTEAFQARGVDWEDYAPHQSTLASMAVHTQYANGIVVGPFIGMANSDKLDASDKPSMVGGLQFMAGDKHRFFSTVGYANVVTDISSGKNDGQFKGGFAEVGLTGELSPSVLYKASLGHGETKIAFYNDEAFSSATYSTAALKLLFPVFSSVFVTGGVEYSEHKSKASSEDGATGARDTRFTLGLVIPIGNGGTATANALRPLAPTLAPVRAAAWNEVLDGRAPSR